MKRNPSFIAAAFLLAADVVTIIISFGLAYYYRTHYDSRPYLLGSDTGSFMLTITSLIPLWFMLLFSLGLYDKSIYLYRPKSYSRLLIASAVGTMGIITFSYFTEAAIFPARLIAVYSFIFCFFLLVIGREFILAVHRLFLRHGIGVLDVAVVGNSANTRPLIEFLHNNKESGYAVVAVVAGAEYIPEKAQHLRYHSLAEAVKAKRVDMVIQTDDIRTEKVYFDSVNHHLQYMFVPGHKALLSHSGEMVIMGAQPVVAVRTTPLMGWARVVKRAFDLVLGSILFILALLPMAIVALCIKLSDPSAKIFHKARRLSRFGKTVTIYKFRTMKPTYNNISPEDAFAKMGKPELAKHYRANGDHLDDDPRIHRFGRFLRVSSLDELPQLFNVIRGDISLVGPRSLVPEELNAYHNKNLILSVKSGLTGLAQVSGRRNISFEERRSLDIYYIQNWSLGLDIQIILKTVVSVLLRQGAK